MRRLGQFIVKRRWWVLAAWVLAAVLIVAFSPSLSSIENNDQSSFLPSNYESIKAGKIAKQLSKYSDSPTDIIVFKNTAGSKLTPSDQQAIQRVVQRLNGDHLGRVISVFSSPQQLAPNKTAQLGTVLYAGAQQDKATIDAVKDVRDALSQATSGTGMTAGLTGGEAISYDTQGTANRALKIVSIGTILLVLFLPAFIFRSPFAGLFPLATVGLVYNVTAALIADAGHLFGFHLSQQLSILFTVVLYGIGTDYILFLLFRYRERLRSGDHTRGAVAFAVSRAGLAILSAALVVLSSFSALFFAKFGIFSSLAPGLVICVAVMMLSALTLVPALLSIIGEKVFWPSKAWMVKAEKPTLSRKVGGLIARHPGRVTGLVSVALLTLAALTLGYKADFSSFSQPPKGSPAAAVFDELNAAFPAGTLGPTEVYVSSTVPMTAGQLQPLKQAVARVRGVSVVLPPQLSADGKTADITVYLKDSPFSAEALKTAGGPIRTVAHGFNTAEHKVYVGGTSSAIYDVQSVTDRDLRVIFPIAAVFIFVILALLLRSLAAPLLLLACVSLGYTATLGATTLLFVDIGGVTGLISFISLFMYIFVVAIGTDYNILTITRLREEIHEGNSPRDAAHLTVEHSSATVAAAGLILAATFGSLTLGGISFLTQMGTAIAIGVSLAAFVIAPFLIPSLSALLGYHIWWPSRRPD